MRDHPRRATIHICVGDQTSARHFSRSGRGTSGVPVAINGERLDAENLVGERRYLND